MTAPLAGIRVVEVANWVAAPTATMLMAEFGAEVVKVEPLAGDGMRGLLRQAVQPDGEAVDHPFQLENRGKQGIAVAIDTELGRDVVRRLVVDADVFVTNLTPERQRRFHLDPDRLRADHPALIYAMLTGFGSGGPEADTPGFDVTAFFARTSLSSLLQSPDQPPVSPRPGQGDHVAGLALLNGILLALRGRDATGAGDIVETSLIASGAWTIATDLAAALVDRKTPKPKHRHDTVSPLIEKYQGSDGRWIQLTMPNVAYWPALCRALGRPDLIDDERCVDPMARYTNRFEIMPELDAAFATAPVATWEERLSAEGCIFQRHQTLSEFVDDPQAEAAHVFGQIDHPTGPFRTVDPPMRLRSQPAGARPAAPEIGEHSRSVLRQAGLTDAEIDALIEADVVGDRPTD